MNWKMGAQIWTTKGIPTIKVNNLSWRLQLIAALADGMKCSVIVAAAATAAVAVDFISQLLSEVHEVNPMVIRAIYSII